MNKDTPSARPASTVVLLRDGADGLETLLLKRNKAVLFAGGLWVFPGGAIEPDDLAAADGDEQQAAMIAAAREAQEESGLQPQLHRMIQLSHWTTPIVEPKRFATWIYAAPIESDDEVVIDGSEIHDSRWLAVKDAAKAHQNNELPMLPPTYITLLDLARYNSVADVLIGEAQRIPDAVFPIFGEDDGHQIVMFRGDAGYESGDGSLPGARHRAVLHEEYWQYVHNNVAAQFPSFVH